MAARIILLVMTLFVAQCYGLYCACLSCYNPDGCTNDWKKDWDKTKKACTDAYLTYHDPFIGTSGCDLGNVRLQPDDGWLRVDQNWNQRKFLESCSKNYKCY